MSTLNTEFCQERLNLVKSLPILRAEDIAEAVGYVLSTSENVQVLCCKLLFCLSEILVAD